VDLGFPSFSNFSQLVGPSGFSDAFVREFCVWVRILEVNLLSFGFLSQVFVLALED